MVGVLLRLSSTRLLFYEVQRVGELVVACGVSVELVLFEPPESRERGKKKNDPLESGRLAGR